MIIRVSTEFTRPANATAYSANDVIGPTGGGSSLLTFGLPYRTVNVVGAQVTSSSTQDATPTLYLATSSTYAPGVDNAAVTAMAYADGPICAVNMIDSGGLYGAFGSVFAIAGGTFPVPFGFPITTQDNKLYGALVAVTGFTPVSAQRFNVSIFVDVPENYIGG